MNSIQHDAQLKNALSILEKIDCYKETKTNLPGDISCPASASLPPIHQEPLVNPSNTPLISTPALEKLRSRIHRKTTKSNNSTLNISKKSSPSLRHETHRTESRRQLNRVVAPNSQTDFLNRLKTFTLKNYPTGKPRFLSPPSMARFGWTNLAKNRLKCQACEASWVISIPSNLDWASASGIQLGELGKRMRIEQHRSSCPWRNRQSPSSIYRPPSWKNCRDTVKALIQSARELSEFHRQSNLRVDHPLPEQSLTALSIVLQSENHQQDSNEESPSCLTIEPLILALFGWSTKSLIEPEAESAPSMNPSNNCLPISLSKTSNLNSSLSAKITTSKQPEEQKGLSCKLCHRQTLPCKNLEHAFNPLTEHREYCPYVDKFCGFEEEQDQELQPRNTGWEYNLEMIEKFIHRMNRSDHHNLDKSNCCTLENIANQFSSSTSFQSNHHPLIGNSSPYSAQSPQNTHRLDHFNSSPQITLLNFVKAVLTVHSPCSKFHP